MADARRLSLTPGRRLRTRVAGMFLLLPLLAQGRCDPLVAPACAPGSGMVPATRALLSLLALQWLDKERRSHMSDCHGDEALGLFAGLNILPKTPFATDDSSRTPREHQHPLLAGWRTPLAPLLLPDTPSCCLDFHPLPSRSDPTGLDTHPLAQRGTAGTSVLPCFAHEPHSRVFCSANAHLTRAAQPGDVMRCGAFWHALAGHAPQWLSFDSKLAPSPALSRIHPRGIWCVTMRRRGAALLRRLHALPAQAWRRTVLAIPTRHHQPGRSVDEPVTLRGSAGPMRQLARDGLGRSALTLLLSNNVDASARELIIRSAGRNGVEDSLGIRVHGFHLDCLAREVRLHVDVDVALTVVANGCYRWLATRLHGFDKAKPTQRYRKCVETGGRLAVHADRMVVRFAKRAHNPILREATLDNACPPIPWLGNLPVAFEYP